MLADHLSVWYIESMTKAHAPAIPAEQLAEHADDSDELDDKEREQLHAALDAADASFRRGEGVPIEVVLAELDALASP